MVKKPEEKERIMLKLTYEEAEAEYIKRRDSRLGRLVGNREMPILKRAGELVRLYLDQK